MIFFKDLPVFDYKGAAEKLYDEADLPDNTVIVVTDDDPTGCQTCHDVPVYTDWSGETILKAFSSDEKMFFILTNSRSFSPEYSKKVHEIIGDRVRKAAAKTKKNFLIISRGDSTLRGHWPLETEALVNGCGGMTDGEILIPFFKEGNRYTFKDIHYVKVNNFLFPAGQTEFAKDTTFSYRSSNLKDYVEEKTSGAVKAGQVVSVTLEELNSMNLESITEKLMNAQNHSYIVVNAVSYDDLKVFFSCFTRALSQGKKFIFRTSASWVKICSKNSDRTFLAAKDVRNESDNGGLIVVGSHVNKTTAQLDYLKNSGINVEFIPFNVNYYTDMTTEAGIVSKKASALIRAGKTVCVYTSRKVVTSPANSPEENLNFSVKVSEAVTSIVTGLSVRPSFIISKGGITSADIGIRGLGVNKAYCIGQVAPGVSVWRTPEESRFGRISYVIFPGNVGEEDTLYNIVTKLL